MKNLFLFLILVVGCSVTLLAGPPMPPALPPWHATAKDLLGEPSNFNVQPITVEVSANQAAVFQMSSNLKNWTFFGSIGQSNTFLTVSANNPKEFIRGIVTNEVVNLTWDADADTNVIDYRIYCGPAYHSYTQINDVGNGTNCTFVIQNVAPTNHFSVTALTASGAESAYSCEATNITTPLILTIKTFNVQLSTNN